MIHRYLNGSPQPPNEFLEAAADELGVRREWQIDGVGAMTEAEERLRRYADAWILDLFSARAPAAVRTSDDAARAFARPVVKAVRQWTKHTRTRSRSVETSKASRSAWPTGFSRQSGGKYHSRTVRTDDRREAETTAIAWHAELQAAHDRETLDLPGVLTFRQLLERYLATEGPNLSPGGRASYEDSFKPFRTFFIELMENPPVSRIRAGHVKEYLSWRRTHRVSHDAERNVVPVHGTVSAHTVARDRRVLHRLFEFAVELEFIEANPCRHVAAPKADPRTPVILSADDFENLLAACEDRPMLRMYVLVLPRQARAHSARPRGSSGPTSIWPADSCT